MQEQLTEIVGYFKGTLKYKWVAMIIAWILCLAGWIAVMALPNKYTSEARVHVETRTMLQPLLRGMTIQTDVGSLLRVMRLLMFTSNNLEQIINLSDLKKDVKNPNEMFELVKELKNTIRIEGGGDELFTIKYESKDPNRAKSVVQAVLTVFSEQTQQSTLAGADVAHRFIDEQIREYEARLRNGEKARENFKRANIGFLPGQGVDNVGQIQQIKANLEAAKLQLNEASSRKDALKIQLDEALASDDEWGLLSENNSTKEDIKIAELKQKKDDLLIKYTHNHPEVVYIEKIIKKMEKLNAEKKAKFSEKGGMDSAVVTNPYIQTIKVEMNTVDANLASIHSRIEIFEQQLQQAQDELNLRLSVETEMQNLNRDYEAIKKNYEQLLASREQASMSEKVDDQTEALKFKIVDPPNLPSKPSSPNRKLLFSGILFAGIGVGIAGAFLMYLMRPVVMSIIQLRELTGLPVLGTITLTPNLFQVHKNKKEILLYGFVFLGLITAYAIFMAIPALKLTSLTRFF